MSRPEVPPGYLLATMLGKVALNDTRALVRALTEGPVGTTAVTLLLLLLLLVVVDVVVEVELPAVEVCTRAAAKGDVGDVMLVMQHPLSDIQ